MRFRAHAPSAGPRIEKMGELVVPNNLTIEEMVQAGHYEYSAPQINSQNFSITRTGPRPLYLVHFEDEIDTAAVERVLILFPQYAHMLIEDSLAVGMHPVYRELQREFRLLSFGSKFNTDGRSLVPLLSNFGTPRRLYLEDYAGKWKRKCRFLFTHAET